MVSWSLTLSEQTNSWTMIECKDNEAVIKKKKKKQYPCICTVTSISTGVTRVDSVLLSL